METLKLLKPDQIKSIDSYAVKTLGFPEILLMENAAHSVFKEISNRFSGYEVIIVCGPGNNGGDGLALARLLKSSGWHVRISKLLSKKFAGSAEINFNLCDQIEKVDIKTIHLTSNTLIVDAIFGIGLNRPPSSDVESVIKKVNNSPAKVLSIDIPSGISGLTGEVLGNTAVKSDITVSLCAPKVGLYMFPGFDYCGHIVNAFLPLPDNIFDRISAPLLNTPVPLKEKARNSNKRSFGRVLTVAGSSSYYGAPYFSSKASLLAGAGYSTLITPDCVKRVCASLAPEVIYRNESDLSSCIEDSSTVIFGPGVGLNSRSRNLFKEVIHNSPENLIIDGDGLTLLAEDPSLMSNFRKLFTVTPHAGEASRLLGITVEDINKNPIESALNISKEFSCITVLKGPHTVIASPDMKAYVNICSSQTLATAGSGDILSGIIAGLTGFVPLLEAARAGVYIHGYAGVIIEREVGMFGVSAVDILKSIPEAINSYSTLSTRESFPAL